MKALNTFFPCALILAAGCFVSGSATPAVPPAQTVDRNEPAVGNAVGAPAWELVWDDKIDDSIDRRFKSCALQLDFRGARLTGEFDGPVLGQPREALFTGKIITSGGPSLLIMEQNEPGYTCIYQMQAAGTGYFGVWQDTRGGKGDVELKPAAGPGLAPQ